MPSHNFAAPRGRLVTIDVDSEALRGNLVGDPTTRSVVVYLPAGYDQSEDRYPLLVGLASYTGSGPKMLAWRAFGESVPQRIDRLTAEGHIGPVVVAFPDCFTSLGGNQYVNSAALGNWEDFLLEEMLPALERELRLRPGSSHRAVFGKSSGGYGALVQGMRHGAHWRAIACHSGDMGFDVVYRRDLPVALSVLDRHDGDVTRFIDYLRETSKVDGKEMYALMLLGLAASYDPDTESPLGIRLPVDPHTAELVGERWQRWLDHDPLWMIERPECQDGLRSLGALYLDCGARDQYFLHYGARAFARRLEALGIEHHYEEFDDDHSRVDYRLDVSLPLLYRAIV
jgi:hypothetical protein